MIIQGMDKDAQDRLVAGLKDVLLSLEGHQDAVLIEYILVLLGSGKERKAMMAELMAFISSREHAERLVRWLFDQLSTSRNISQLTPTTTNIIHHQKPIKSVVSIAAGAAVSKASLKSPTTHTILKGVIDSVVKSNNNNNNSTKSVDVKDARDIINLRRRSVDERLSPVFTTVSVPPTTTVQQQPQQPQPQPIKKTVRCPDFPDCPKTDEECGMVHPRELCKYFPNCLYGKDCLFFHPPVPCRFADRCQNAVCNFTHSDAGSVPLETTLTIPCRFNERCRRPNCPFLHTVALPCPQGAQCMRPACPFTHPSDHAQPAPRALVNRPCRFGRACAKADCPFQHPKPPPQDAASVIVNENAAPPNKEP